MFPVVIYCHKIGTNGTYLLIKSKKYSCCQFLHKLVWLLIMPRGKNKSRHQFSTVEESWIQMQYILYLCVKLISQVFFYSDTALPGIQRVNPWDPRQGCSHSEIRAVVLEHGCQRVKWALLVKIHLHVYCLGRERIYI